MNDEDYSYDPGTKTLTLTTEKAVTVSTPGTSPNWNDVADGALVIDPGAGASQTVTLDGCNLGLRSLERPVISVKSGDVTISHRGEEGLLTMQYFKDAGDDQVGIVTVEAGASLSFSGEGYLRIHANTLSDTPILGVRGSNIRFLSGEYYIEGTDNAPAIGDLEGDVSHISFEGADVNMTSGSTRGDVPCVGSVKGNVTDVSISSGNVSLIGTPCIGSRVGDVSEIKVTGGTASLTPGHNSRGDAPLVGTRDGNASGITVSNGTMDFEYSFNRSWNKAPIFGTAASNKTCSDVVISDGEFEIGRAGSDWDKLRLVTTGQAGDGKEPVVSGGRWNLSNAALGDQGKPSIEEYPSDNQSFLGVDLPDEYVVYYVKTENYTDKVWRIIPEDEIRHPKARRETYRAVYDGKELSDYTFEGGLEVLRGDQALTFGYTLCWRRSGENEWVDWSLTSGGGPRDVGSYDVLVKVPSGVNTQDEFLYAAEDIVLENAVVIDPLKLGDGYQVTIYASKPYDGKTGLDFSGVTLTVIKDSGSGSEYYSFRNVSGKATFDSPDVGETDIKITELSGLEGIIIPEGGVSATATPGIVRRELTRLVGAKVTPRAYDGTDAAVVEGLYLQDSDRQLVYISADDGLEVEGAKLFDEYLGYAPNVYLSALLPHYVTGCVTTWPSDSGYDFSDVKTSFTMLPCYDEHAPEDAVSVVTRRKVSVEGFEDADKVYDGTNSLPDALGSPVFSNQVKENPLLEDEYELNATSYASKDAGVQAIEGSISLKGPRTLDEALEGIGDSSQEEQELLKYLSSAAWNYEIVDVNGTETADISTTATGTISRRPLTVEGVSVSDKAADGTATAEVTSVTFGNLVESESLSAGKDYTVTAAFSDAEPGEEKEVTVTVSLIENGPVSKNYCFKDGGLTTVVTTTASISGATHGGGSGGGSVTPVHDIEVVVTGGGAAEADRESAREGSKVTVTTSPDEGRTVASVTVVDGDGNIIEVTSSGNSWSFEMPSGDVTVNVTFECDGGSLCPTRDYLDVDQDAWYHEAVDWAVENGVLNGYGEGGEFLGPVADVTRAEMAQMLWNRAGRPEAEADLSAFTDVDAGGWYAPALEWCVSEGIFSGYGDTFGTERVISREEAATVLWRVAGSPEADADLSGYGDASKVSDYAAGAIEWAVSTGVLTGKGGVALDPQAGCTRGEVAAMMMRMAV